MTAAMKTVKMQNAENFQRSAAAPVGIVAVVSMNITRNPATRVHTKLIDVEFAAVCVATESTLAFKVVCAISATGEASRPTASAEFLINTFTVLLQGYG